MAVAVGRGGELSGRQTLGPLVSVTAMFVIEGDVMVTLIMGMVVVGTSITSKTSLLWSLTVAS